MPEPARPQSQIEKPVSILFKPLKADFKKLFLALSKATLEGTTGVIV